MKIGTLTKIVADAYKVEEKTVTLYARLLREAGLLTTGARGVNAPHMLPLDAARLTIALLATNKPSKAVELVGRYGNMNMSADESAGDLPGVLFDGDPTLERVLVRMTALDPDAKRWTFWNFPYIEVRQNDKSAMIEMQGGRAVFRDTASNDLASVDRSERGGIWRNHGLIPATLMKMATELWSDRFQGCDEAGLPLSLNHSWNDELRGEERAKRHQEIFAYIRARDVDWRKGAD